MIAPIDARYSTPWAGQSDFGAARIAMGLEFSHALRTARSVEDEAEPAPRTVDEVKKEFYDYLDSLELSSGLAGAAISVRITDAAFEKMLADPGYMQKMKELCARDLCDPRWNRHAAMGISPSAMVITIDADCEEEYLASSFNSPDDRRRADGEDFWNRRKEKNKAILEQQEEWAAKRREWMALLVERAGERRAALQSSLVASGITGVASVQDSGDGEIGGEYGLPGNIFRL